MSFWEKIKQSLRNFMSGRNGADRLGLTLLWTGLILYILGTLIGTASGTFWMLLGSLLNLAGFGHRIHRQRSLSETSSASKTGISTRTTVYAPSSLRMDMPYSSPNTSRIRCWMLYSPIFIMPFPLRCF